MLNRPHPVFLILNLPIAALSVTVLIFATYSADAFAQSGPGGVDKEGEWHVGEGLEQGDYFHYTLCHVNYKDCKNFEFEFWIKEDVAVGSETELLAEVLVRDGGKVVVGNMTPWKDYPRAHRQQSGIEQLPARVRLVCDVAVSVCTCRRTKGIFRRILGQD